ncbi:hypothetical protein CRM22_001676 [Opisthorchis felineus]|uniref:NADPH:adrenodoxin oxidoreductase, mitochondrial n=1 Tax=Opisthorchis felineus TaxID=147828 RepID=A0A4S2MFG6_OPIFE|nr:hypothetical protein CRM22_001676 [Opisthorchis felineus]TGZ73168.1 hypothetical protein CRM22_001676 [Opisthorchis felineus]
MVFKMLFGSVSVLVVGGPLPAFAKVIRTYASRPYVCIVGSGPSAFYTAQYLLRHHSSLLVDMYEKLPAPFGLVRYGVAPDHPEVKNVINTFTEVAKSPRFKFIGNVTVGVDVRLRELQRAYASVILAYGAAVDQHLNIPGESLPGVISAKDLVAWYNGSPGLSDFTPDFDCDTVAVVGLGNVAIDVARILLSSSNRLKNTDIPEPVISVLSASRIRRVILIGRRGPLQAAFTLKEVRELSRLNISENGESSQLLPLNFLPPRIMQTTVGSGEQLTKLLSELPRPRRRLTQFLLQLADQKPGNLASKHCDFLFLRSPVRIIAREPSADCSWKSAVGKLELSVNQLIGSPSEQQQVQVLSDAPHELLECGLVVRSIGYRSVQIDQDLPFDHDRGVIKSKDTRGRVADSDDGPGDPLACPLYCAGWAKRGAIGVIVNTSLDARDVAETVLLDLASAELKGNPCVVQKNGLAPELLQARGLRTISFSDWERVDAVEKLAGRALGKPREKLTSVEALLGAAFADIVQHKRNN